MIKTATDAPAHRATREWKLRVQVDMVAVQLCVRLPCAKLQVPAWASPAKAKKRRQRMTFFITRSSVGGSAAHGATRRKAVNRKMSVVTKSEHCKKDRSLGDLRGGSARRNWDFCAPSVRLEAESIPHLLAATFGADAVLLPKFRYSRFPDPLTCLSSAALLAFNELFGRSPNEDRVFVNIHGERLKGDK